MNGAHTRGPREALANNGSPGLGSLRGLLWIAIFLSASGGFLDAYSFLARGHVFANAQTGNVVLFAVLAAAGQWDAALRHIPPIVAFALGVATAEALGVRPQKRTFRATLICQVCELMIVVILGVAGGGLPDTWVVPVIAFVAALQHTSFGMIGPYAFNSAMTTGNLRDATAGLVRWATGREPDVNRSRSASLGLVCLAFLGGALAGAFCTRRDPAHALLACSVLLLVALLLTWRERQRQKAP